MKNFERIIEVLIKVRWLFECQNYQAGVQDLDWCISLIKKVNKFDHEWIQFSVVCALEMMSSNYHLCLSKAIDCKRNNDEVMCRNYHIMANNWCKSMKEVAILLL